MAIAVLILLLGTAAALLYVAIAGVAVSSGDVAWLAGTLPPPAEANVYARYLERHRRYRLTGGLFGAVFAVVVGVRWYGSISIGIGEGSPLADILFCTLAGTLVGALLAERFRLSDPESTTVAASLSPREEPAGRSLVGAARTIAAASIALGALVAAAGSESLPLVVALCGGGVVLIAEATRAAIIGRRRPLLSERAGAVDLRIRAFAVTSIAQLELAAAVLTAGWTISKVPNFDGDVLQVLRFLVVIGCLVAAVALLRRAAPRPPRGWARS